MENPRDVEKTCWKRSLGGFGKRKHCNTLSYPFPVTAPLSRTQVPTIFFSEIVHQVISAGQLFHTSYKDLRRCGPHITQYRWFLVLCNEKLHSSDKGMQCKKLGLISTILRIYANATRYSLPKSDKHCTT